MEINFYFNTTGKKLNDDDFTWDELPSCYPLEELTEDHYFYYGIVHIKLLGKSGVITPIKVLNQNTPLKAEGNLPLILKKIKESLEVVDNLWEMNCHLERPVVTIYENTDEVLNKMFKPKELLELMNDKDSYYHSKSQGFKLVGNSIVSVFKPEIILECNKYSSEILDRFVGEVIDKVFNNSIDNHIRSQFKHELYLMIGHNKFFISKYKDVKSAIKYLTWYGKNKISENVGGIQKHRIKDNNLIIDIGLKKTYFVVTNVNDLDY